MLIDVESSMGLVHQADATEVTNFELRPTMAHCFIAWDHHRWQALRFEMDLLGIFLNS